MNLNEFQNFFQLFSLLFLGGILFSLVILGLHLYKLKKKIRHHFKSLNPTPFQKIILGPQLAIHLSNESEKAQIKELGSLTLSKKTLEFTNFKGKKSSIPTANITSFIRNPAHLKNKCSKTSLKIKFLLIKKAIPLHTRMISETNRLSNKNYEYFLPKAQGTDFLEVKFTQTKNQKRCLTWKIDSLYDWELAFRKIKTK